MKKYCLGFMGMTVRDYNTIMYPDLLCKIKGYRDRMNYEERVMRKVGFSALISASIVGSKSIPKNEHEYWPIAGDEQPELPKSNIESKKEAFKKIIEKINGKI